MPDPGQWYSVGSKETALVAMRRDFLEEGLYKGR